MIKILCYAEHFDYPSRTKFKTFKFLYMYQGEGLGQGYTHSTGEHKVHYAELPKNKECPFLQHISEDPELLAAYKLVIDKFQGKKRRTGEPAYTHSIAVAEIIFYATEEMANTKQRNVMLLISKLHDLLEDTKTEPKDIRIHFGSNILENLKLLTRERKSEDPILNQENYWAYIDGLDRAPSFVQIVKMADRLHNLRTLLATNDIQFISRQIEETNKVYLPRFLSWVERMQSEYQSTGWKLLNEINQEANSIELEVSRIIPPTSSEDQAFG